MHSLELDHETSIHYIHMERKSNSSRLGEVANDIASHGINPPDQDSDESLQVFICRARPIDIPTDGERLSDNHALRH